MYFDTSTLSYRSIRQMHMTDGDKCGCAQKWHAKTADFLIFGGFFFVFFVVVEMQRDSNELKEPLSFLKSSSRD